MAEPESVIQTFSARQAATVVGTTERTLAYWDATGLFRPQFPAMGDGRSMVRVYSFRDLVSLRTLRLLRDRHGVSLQHLRTVQHRLARYSDAPFAELRLRVYGREVHFEEPGTGQTRGVVSGQFVMLPIMDVVNDVNESLARMTRRSESDLGKTEQHRNINHNAIVISGTRVPVRAIARFLAAGYSTAQILAEYPTITAIDVEAVRSRVERAEAA